MIVVVVVVVSTRHSNIFNKDQLIFNTHKNRRLPMTSSKEAVLFNSDTLSKIISYLPSIDVLNLAITCKGFGISDVDKQSVIKKSAHILVHEIATEEQLAALPHYDGESSLADYHYLRLRGNLFVLISLSELSTFMKDVRHVLVPGIPEAGIIVGSGLNGELH